MSNVTNRGDCKVADMNKMVWIKSDGSVELFDETNDIIELQRKVGGYVEMIRANGWVMLVDEEARIREKKPPCNEKASKFLGVSGKYRILGDVVMCLWGKDGEFKGIPEDDAKQFLED